MGITEIEGTVTGPGGKRVAVIFLVDSGATFTVLPQKVWREIELVPADAITLCLADGTHIERKMSECWIEIPQGARSTPVILGENGDQALLGAVTLEELRLVLNPLTRQLQPVRAMLA